MAHRRASSNPKDQLAKSDPTGLKGVKADLHGAESQAAHLITKPGRNPDDPIIMLERPKAEACTLVVEYAHEHSLETGKVECLGQRRSKD